MQKFIQSIEYLVSTYTLEFFLGFIFLTIIALLGVLKPFSRPNYYYFIARRLGDSKRQTFSFIVNRIAIVSIALGLAVILVAFNILVGFQDEIQHKLFSFSGHLLIKQRSNNNSYEETPISLNTDLYKNYTSLSTVDRLHAVAQKAGILKTEEEVLGVILKGVDKKYDQTKFASNIQKGTFIHFKPKEYSHDILISQKIADKLKLSLNDTITMFFIQDPPRFRKLHVTGIYETGMEEFDEKLIIGDIGLIRRLNNWSDTLAGAYEIFVRDFEEVHEKAIPEVWDYLEHDMGIESITDTHRSIFEWLGLVSKNVSIFLALILIVASFNMISILLIMIMERIQMIGLLKAMGATNLQIRRIFIYKGVFLVAKGMGLGNLAGLGFCALQDYFKFIPLDPENYYMNTVPIAWDWTVIMGMNLLTFSIISMILLLPTIIVSRLKPIKTIRFN